MTIRLSPAQAALYEEGGGSRVRIEEDMLEDLERHTMQEPVVGTMDHGTVRFAVVKGVVR